MAAEEVRWGGRLLLLLQRAAEAELKGADGWLTVGGSETE